MRNKNYVKKLFWRAAPQAVSPFGLGEERRQRGQADKGSLLSSSPVPTDGGQTREQKGTWTDQVRRVATTGCHCQ